MTTPHWIFFDLGNTLIDESAPIAEWISSLTEDLRGRGYDVSDDDLEKALIEASIDFAPTIITRALEILGFSDAVEIDSLVTGRYRKELERPFPETLEVLRDLSQRYSLGIIANQSAGTRDRLESYGLLQYLSVLVSSTEEGIAKPDPAIFELAAARAGCCPEWTFMVGDRIDNDIAPAKALGWGTIRMLRGFARFQIPRSSREEPDHVIESLSDIRRVLRC